MKVITLSHQVEETFSPALHYELPLKLLAVRQHQHDTQEDHSFGLARRLVDAAHQGLHESLLKDHLSAFRYDS